MLAEEARILRGGDEYSIEEIDGLIEEAKRIYGIELEVGRGDIWKMPADD